MRRDDGWKGGFHAATLTQGDYAMDNQKLPGSAAPTGHLQVRIRNIHLEGERINSYVLEPLPGERLPPFEPGAHIDVMIAPGLIRSYSLASNPDEQRFYEIAVHHTSDSRGGSRLIHGTWRVGDIIEIAGIKNNFPLVEDAAETVLIAGGIGVTPMLPMIARLQKLGRRWRLHYVAASPERAAYVERLSGFPHVTVSFDGVEGGRRLDLKSICETAADNAHLYCCGPTGMLDAFVECTRSRPSGHAHIEYFAAETEFAKDGGYTVELARTGRELAVNKGETILDSLLAAGIDVGFACAEGVCGSCQVGVLDGIPDHRDHFLTDQEKEANKVIMVCCSGSRSRTLVLDL
jgi:vanillate O-demethylase ferredoxin subunit